MYSSTSPEFIFSTALRKARIKAGLTQKQLADKLYMTQQGINKWENGECLPRLDKMKELVEILDIDPYELLFEPSDTYKQDLKALAEELVPPGILDKTKKKIDELPEDALRLWKYDKRYPLWLKFQLQEILLGIYKESSHNKELFDDFFIPL